MSPLVTRPLPPRLALRQERLEQEPEAPLAPADRLWREAAVVFAVAFAAYVALGLYTTLSLDIVLGDAQSRLAHAYFALWNEPAKLTAIGFYWPPLQTLVLLPFAAVKPFATSLAALPIPSALFAALTAALVYRAVSLAGVGRVLRAAVTTAFALNPIVLYFAVNGMAESLYLFLLALAVAHFVRWSEAPRWQELPIAGTALALGILARYEVGAWVPLLVAGAVAVLIRARASIARIEAAVLALVVPCVYAVALWTYVNWVLTGDPTEYLAVANAIQEEPHGSALWYVGRTLTTQLALFPLTAAVLAGTLWLGIRRRSPVGLVLAASLLVPAALTMTFAIETRTEVPLLLRYNLRAIPLTLIAGAWLVASLPVAARRRGVLVLLAGVLLSAPATVATMLRADGQLGEASFLRALVSGESQDGKPGPKGPGLSIADQRDMAAFVSARIPGRGRILADDAQAFGVMLLDGRPERYFDRIDRGERAWFRARNNPVGRVDYLLVKRGATQAEDPVFYDRILQAYPGLGTGEPPPFARPVHENGTFSLFRVQGPRTSSP